MEGSACGNDLVLTSQNGLPYMFVRILENPGLVLNINVCVTSHKGTTQLRYIVILINL